MRLAQNSMTVKVGAKPARFARMSVLAAAFLALLVQIVVVQTHVHTSAPSQSRWDERVLGGTISAIPAPVAYDIADLEAACPICQALHAPWVAASAGAVAIGHDLFWRVEAVVVRRIEARLPAASHAWQSRGPPTVL